MAYEPRAYRLFAVAASCLAFGVGALFHPTLRGEFKAILALFGSGLVIAALGLAVLRQHLDEAWAERERQPLHAAGEPSFPLDGARGLGADVVDDAVDAGYLVDDPAGDHGEHLGRYACPVGGHAVH